MIEFTQPTTDENGTEWKHLSDLHLKFKNCSTPTARKALIEELERCSCKP